jgi:hypothetical protein
LAEVYESMGRDEMRAWEKSCPTLKNWKSAPTYALKKTRRGKKPKNPKDPPPNSTNSTAPNARHNLRGCCVTEFDYNTRITRATSHDDFTIPLPAPQGAPATAGTPSGTPPGDFLNTNLSLGGKENEDQSTVTVTGNAAGASSAMAGATVAAAPLELGTGIINSNSSSSDSSSHRGGVNSQHSQLTPSDTHHIHTTMQHPGGELVRPHHRFLRLSRFNPLLPPWEPRDASARAREGDEDARGTEGDEDRPNLATLLRSLALRGPTMTPPIPITARPHLARGPTDALPLQLTHDPAGSISEPAGAS